MKNKDKDMSTNMSSNQIKGMKTESWEKGLIKFLKKWEGPYSELRAFIYYLLALQREELANIESLYEVKINRLKKLLKNQREEKERI